MKLLPNMFKFLIALAIMVTMTAMWIGSINAANSATPIRDVTITGENITLGDVFDGIEKNMDFVLAPAPKPDTTITWDARTLNRVAKAFDLPWRATTTDQIHIRRLASLVTQDMVEDAVKAALKDEGLSGAYDLDFVGAKPEFILPHDIEPSITVEASSYNASRQTFSATLRTPDNKVRQVSGVAYPLVAIPVLKTPLARGDVITRNMITSMDIRADFVTEKMIVQNADLIGMTPRRVLRANAPVAIADLDKPVVVKRGDLVTMELKNGPISITAIAKAMENGTKGDMIRVMNVDSKRTLQAEVTGIRTARVFN
jgi:flagella basal body P-ring formation protein FlgA